MNEPGAGSTRPAAWSCQMRAKVAHYTDIRPAQAVPARVCKIVGERLTRFESWTCHQRLQVRPGTRAGPGGLRERCPAPPTQRALTRSPVGHHLQDTGDQPGYEYARSRQRMQQRRRPQRSGSRAKYVPKNSLPGEALWATVCERG